MELSTKLSKSNAQYIQRYIRQDWELEIVERNQMGFLEHKNTIIEIKDAVTRFNIRLDTNEERSSEVEAR